MAFQNLVYPLDLTFKITTLASDFTIKNAHGNEIGYVRQKMFKLKEDVIIYNDSSKSKELFRIRANQWLDFNASYNISEAGSGKIFGKLTRKGMRSFWKSTYEIFDNGDNQTFTVTENNPWIKVFDGLVNEIPVVGMFTGYFLNPSYSVTDRNGNKLFTLKKMPSMIGRRFKLEKNASVDHDDESLIILSYMMMVLLERTKG